MLSNKFKINYSIGSVANGVKTDTFTFFLLFFYSNIIGLNPGLAGSAIFIALCIDAITDPLMGTISDRTNSDSLTKHIKPNKTRRIHSVPSYRRELGTRRDCQVKLAKIRIEN